MFWSKIKKFIGFNFKNGSRLLEYYLKFSRVFSFPLFEKFDFEEHRLGSLLENDWENAKLTVA